MATVDTQSEIQVLRVRKEIDIAAPIDVVFQTIVDQVGLYPEDRVVLKLEPWPGGRWFRDLGNNTGHLWGHVQVIKPPTLLELVGPMMFSYAAASHVQYRLSEEGGKTKLALVHQAIGLLTKEHMEGVNQGWGIVVENVAKKAKEKAMR